MSVGPFDNLPEPTPAIRAFMALALEKSKKGIIEAVARESGYSVADILGDSRCQPLALWRQIAMTRCVEVGWSLNSVGRTFNRDHTTIIHAKRRVERFAADRGFQLEHRA